MRGHPRNHRKRRHLQGTNLWILAFAIIVAISSKSKGNVIPEFAIATVPKRRKSRT
ncbi:MAG: hypothetical protein HPY65_05365 [Syntrophaceae bacterium]|nr:hypothetical protein [Syntrophaceae bacterium]